MTPKAPAKRTSPATTRPLTGADGRTITILVAEDNEDDVELMLEALQESRVDNRPHVARDGVEALDFLHKRGTFASAPTPDIVFLDLNMPRKSGREVLAEIKKDKRLAQIPVVILTTSKAEEDVLRSYELQAAAFVTKPVDFNRFVEAIKAIDTFWFRIVAYPPK